MARTLMVKTSAVWKIFLQLYYEKTFFTETSYKQKSIFIHECVKKFLHPLVSEKAARDALYTYDTLTLICFS